MSNGWNDFADGFAGTFVPTFSSTYDEGVRREEDTIKENVRTFRTNKKIYDAAEKENKKALETAKMIAQQFNQPADAVQDIAYQVKSLGASTVFNNFKDGYTLTRVKNPSPLNESVTSEVSDDANETTENALSTDGQMSSGALGDQTQTDDTTDTQTEKSFFGDLRDKARDRQQKRIRSQTLTRLGVEGDVYDQVLAGYTSDITPSGNFRMTAPAKAADYKTVYTEEGGVETYDTSTADGRKKYQAAVKGGATPISKPSLSAMESMNEGQKYIKPDYVTLYDSKTNTYSQVNIATKEGGTKADELVAKGYIQVKDPSVKELETSGFNIDVTSLKSYGAAFAASEHLKALEASGVKVPSEVVSAVNNILTELKPEETTKKPEWVAVRIGDGPTRYYNENDPDDVKLLKKAQDEALQGKKAIRFFNVSTEPKDEEFKAPEWTGTKSSYHAILHRANTNSNEEGPVGDWARNWLKNEKASIEVMVEKPESITEAFIKSEYTRLFEAAQGKEAGSEEVKSFEEFKQNTLPGYMEIHSKLNPEKPLTFAQELAKLSEMENASPGTYTSADITAQREKANNLLLAQTVEGIAKDEAGKTVRIVNEADGNYINATQIVSTDGTISFKLPDGTEVNQDEFRVVKDREVEDSAQAISRTSTDRRKYNENLTTAVGAVSLGGEVVELVNKDKRALTFAGRRIATFLSSGAREADAISSIIGGYFEGKPEDAELTMADAEKLLRDNGILSGGQTFESLLSQDTTDLASVANQLEAKTFLMAFRAGGLEGQSGQAMSNRDFDRLLKIIRNSTDEATFKQGINDYLNDRVQAVNSAFGTLNQSPDLRIFKENYGYSPLRGADLVRSWQDVSTDVNDARLMRSLDILGLDPNRPPLAAYQYLQNNPGAAQQFADKYGEQYLPFSMRGSNGDQ